MRSVSTRRSRLSDSERPESTAHSVSSIRSSVFASSGPAGSTPAGSSTPKS